MQTENKNGNVVPFLKESTSKFDLHRLVLKELALNQYQSLLKEVSHFYSCNNIPLKKLLGYQVCCQHFDESFSCLNVS